MPSKKEKAEKEISPHVLQMKFMQRSLKRKEKETERISHDNLRKAYLANGREGMQARNNKAVEPSSSSSTAATPHLSEHAESAQVKKSLPIIYEYRYDLLEDLLFGRFSFLGFNPEVEKLMQYYSALRNEAATLEEGEWEGEKDIQDAEMAQFFGSASDTVSRRYQTKRQRNVEGSSSSGTDDAVPMKRTRGFMRPSDAT